MYKYNRVIVRFHFIATFLLLACCHNNIWFYSHSLRYQLSGSWSPKQCWVWVPHHGVCPKQNQILAGNSHKFCATIVLAYLAGRTPLQIKRFLLGWCLCFTSGSTHNNFLNQKVAVKALYWRQFDVTISTVLSSEIRICQFVKNTL